MTTHRNSRQTSKFSIGLGTILAVAALLLIVFGAWKLCARQEKQHPQLTTETSLLLNTVTEPSLPEQLISYPGMKVSFNSKMHVPNWVAWELTADEAIGDEPRYNKFYCDPDVEGCPETYDYNYSGYDRGHMAPAGDMKWSADAMRSSFSLANICPQAKSLNTGAWKRLEEKCRTWAQADSSVIIICGPILNDPIREFIGDTRVAVPKRFFKVILSPKADPIRAIGFIMSNDKVPGGMQAAAVSVDEVERITGHDFFSYLPDDIENDVESQCDFHLWSTIKPKKQTK